MKDIGQLIVYLIVSAVIAILFYGILAYAFDGVQYINQAAYKLEPLRDALASISPEFSKYGPAWIVCGILGLVIAKFIVYAKLD